MSEDSGIRFVYTTTDGAEKARAIGRELVRRRLVACVNIFDPMTSIFPWDGQIEEAKETMMIAKTRSDLLPAVTEAILELHDYDCPCVVALPVTGGHSEFLDWISAETRSPVADP